MLPHLKRQVLDADVEISFKRRSYNGKQKNDSEKFRMIAIMNKETEKYHTYITNIPSDVLDAEDIAKLYGARWDIELVFKELKSRYAMDVVNTTNKNIVEAYIWIAMLTLLVSRRIYTIVRSNNEKEMKLRYTQLRWSTIFSENANNQLRLMLKYCGIEMSLEMIMEVYSSQALDPHVNRQRFREEWWA